MYDVSVPQICAGVTLIISNLFWLPFWKRLENREWLNGSPKFTKEIHFWFFATLLIFTLSCLDGMFIVLSAEN